jgi:predicted permease
LGPAVADLYKDIGARLTVLMSVVAPVFGIMFLGILAGKLEILDKNGVKGLVLFAFNFAIPVLLFRSLARIELPDDIQWGFLLSFYAGSFITYGLGMAAGRFVFGRTLDQQAIFGMGASFSNTVLVGIPIILTAFGPEASLPLFLIIAFHSATFMPLTVGLIQIGRGGDVSFGRQLRGVFLEVVRNPIVMGLFLGFVANQAGITLPGPVDRFTELLGGAAVPCALFAMGASLAGYPLMGDVPPAILLTSLKLVIHPVVVWIVAVPILGLEGLWVPVAVVMGGMPTGVNVYLFGARYDAASGVAARTVFLTSLFSMGTISILLMLLQG